jgi:hypothetical protein
MTIRPIMFLTDTAGFDVEWASGFPLTPEQQDAMFYRHDGSWVCTIKKNGFVVDVYCDGDTRIKTQAGDVYRCGDDLISAGYDTDKKLGEALSTDELIHENNSWFDLYVHGEHLDCVSHEINDALSVAMAWLDEEIENAKQIEIGVPLDFPAITV